MQDVSYIYLALIFILMKRNDHILLYLLTLRKETLYKNILSFMVLIQKDVFVPEYLLKESYEIFWSCILILLKSLFYNTQEAV